MSIKIYDAFRYEITNISDIAPFHKRMIETCQYAYYNRFIEMVGDAVLGIASAAIAQHSESDKLFALHMENVLYEGISEKEKESILSFGKDLFDVDNIETNKDAMMGFIKNVFCSYYMCVSRMKIRKQIVPLSMEINLYYVDNSILIVPHEGNTNVISNMLENMDDIRDYHYQDSGDKPDNISKKEWKERRENWEKATTTYFNHFHFGNGTTIIVDDPHTVAPLLPYGKNFTDDIDGVVKDVLKYIQFSYAGIKRSMSKELIHRYVVNTMSPYNDGNVMKYIQTLNKKCNELKTHYSSKCLDFENRMDESFETIIDVKESEK